MTSTTNDAAKESIREGEERWAMARRVALYGHPADCHCVIEHLENSFLLGMVEGEERGWCVACREVVRLNSAGGHTIHGSVPDNCGPVRGIEELVELVERAEVSLEAERAAMRDIKRRQIGSRKMKMLLDTLNDDIASGRLVRREDVLATEIERDRLRVEVASHHNAQITAVLRAEAAEALRARLAAEAEGDQS